WWVCGRRARPAVAGSVAYRLRLGAAEYDAAAPGAAALERLVVTVREDSGDVALHWFRGLGRRFRSRHGGRRDARSLVVAPGARRVAANARRARAVRDHRYDVAVWRHRPRAARRD